MVYFDNASTSFPKAPGVADAMKQAVVAGCFNPGRGSYAGAWQMAETVYETRVQLARFFGGPDSRNVIFTGGVTAALNMALQGLVRPGEHVVATAMEHNAVLRPLRLLENGGVKVDIVDCESDGQLQVAALEEKLKPDTRLVVMNYASNVCGTVLPIEEVGRICREQGILFVVDCAQSGGVLPVNMDKTGIDVLAFAGHKGLLGPQGIGGMLLSARAAKEMQPLMAGGTGSFSESLEVPAVLPDRFEPGTLNLPGIVGLKAALDWLEQTGIESIHRKEMQLLAQFNEGVGGLDGLRLVGPKGMDKRIAVASLDFLNSDNGEAAYRLQENYGIMTRSGLHCAPLAHKALGTYPKGTVRCSFGYFNTPQQVEQLIKAVRDITAQG